MSKILRSTKNANLRKRQIEKRYIATLLLKGVPYKGSAKMADLKEWENQIKVWKESSSVSWEEAP
jgi:hypothetical protein